MLPTTGCVPTRSYRRRNSRPHPTERESASPSLRGRQRRAQASSVGFRGGALGERNQRRPPRQRGQRQLQCPQGTECEKRNARPNASLSAAAVADSLAPPELGCPGGDLDEHRRALRVRWTVEKNERYRHLDRPDDLFAAILATLPARADRDLDAPLFPDLDETALR